MDLNTKFNNMNKDELTKALYLFRDLWCQNIDLSTIDEFIDDYAEQQVKNLNIPAVSKSVCDDCTAYPFDDRGKTPLCKTCKDNPSQTVL